MTVRALHERRFDVRDIRGTSDEGLPDKLIWELALEEGRLLITTDRGFTQYREEHHHGILIIRLRQPNREKIHNRVMEAINKFNENEWPGMLVVMRDSVQSVWKKQVDDV